MKEAGYLLFAFFFYVFRLFGRRRDNRIFCVATNDASSHGNVGMVLEELKKTGEYEVCLYGRDQRREAGKAATLFRFFLRYPYWLATSSLILQDNIFLPMAYLRFSPRVKVVQLWHGTGTIKKFGQDVNEGRLKELEKRANQTITHLIVNGPAMTEQYGRAFGIGPEKIFPVGMPRTDLLIRKKKEGDDLVRAEYPVLQGRKLILYVPTFRDEETEHPRLALDPGAFCEKLGEEYVLGIRLHPHVAAAFRLEETKGVINFSSYPDLDRLLLAADMLVTDYSSVAFDYAVLERPMFFYAYDLESFSRDGRGFYEAYETLVPGPVARTQEELEQLISSGVFDREKIESFLERYYECTDGRSTGRVCDLIREKER